MNRCSCVGQVGNLPHGGRRFEQSEFASSRRKALVVPAQLDAMYVTAVSVLLLAAMGFGGIVFYRLDRRRPVLRVEPRRAVPWTGWDVLVIFGVYVACSVAVVNVGVTLFHLNPAVAPVIENPNDLERSHAVARLVSGAQDWRIIAVCSLVAVVIAPVTEELLFRLFLQGWFEKSDRTLRRRLPMLAEWFRWGTLPVVVTSALFALPHFRSEPVKFDPNLFLLLLVSDGIAKSTAVVVGLLIARRVRGASWADLGWQPERLLPDVVLGVVVFAAVSIPIYLVQFALIRLLPPGWTPDPIPLFFFALALGTLYLRTHRIVPSIAAHMGLNGISMAMLLMSAMMNRGG
jgi:membrane protease YdiL (CAAX protease family)